MGSSRFWLRAVGLAARWSPATEARNSTSTRQASPTTPPSSHPRVPSWSRSKASTPGSIPGAQLVCRLFPKSAAASEVNQDGLPGPQCQAPTGERTTQLTPDVVAFNDPASVTGTGSGSGGSLSSIGAVMYPQLAFSATDSVNVAVLSCTLPPTRRTCVGRSRATFWSATRRRTSLRTISRPLHVRAPGPQLLGIGPAPVRRLGDDREHPRPARRSE